mgnify:CR=1 FL=1
MIEYSFITTNYNKGDVIEESLRSLASSMTENSELLIVDGGSSDNSVDTIKELQTELEDIRLIQQPANLGEGRQIALDRARGEIVIQHLDTDRRYEPKIKYLIDIYHEIEDKKGPEVVLATFDSIYVSRKETAQDIGGWPALGRVEERVFVDRVINRAELVVFPAILSEELPSKDVTNRVDRAQKWTRTLRDLLRTGFDPSMLVAFHHNQFSMGKAILADALIPLAMIQTIGKKKYAERERESWREIESWENALFETEWGRELYKSSLYPSCKRDNEAGGTEANPSLK